jgi:hypothetical protein
MPIVAATPSSIQIAGLVQMYHQQELHFTKSIAERIKTGSHGSEYYWLFPSSTGRVSIFRNTLVTISSVSLDYRIADIFEHAADGSALAHAAVMTLYLVGYCHHAVDSKTYKATCKALIDTRWF